MWKECLIPLVQSWIGRVDCQRATGSDGRRRRWRRRRRAGSRRRLLRERGAEERGSTVEQLRPPCSRYCAASGRISTAGGRRCPGAAAAGSRSTDWHRLPPAHWARWLRIRAPLSVVARRRSRACPVQRWRQAPLSSVDCTRAGHFNYTPSSQWRTPSVAITFNDPKLFAAAVCSAHYQQRHFRVNSSKHFSDYRSPYRNANSLLRTAKTSSGKAEIKDINKRFWTPPHVNNGHVCWLLLCFRFRAADGDTAVHRRKGAAASLLWVCVCFRARHL